MSEMQWNIKFITKFLTLQLQKMLYSDVLLMGSNPVRIKFWDFLELETVFKKKKKKNQPKKPTFVPFLGIQSVCMKF